MRTKKITYLSELYEIIGTYLQKKGDADIRSINTHSNDSWKYSLSVHNLKELNEFEEDIIRIDYHNVLVGA